ncbi:MAG: sigma-70 family RNA polymerase sigma factor [Candidatus Aminicenantes bacterium]|nr:sigma-70 family RNA polymerase sigma factor [Candidatus Aminicenantes bacterium]MCK5613859.1 sigma-70 family RNA polymerase sigma factor [Candidatus Pacearchaeota archaeon]
MDVEKDLFEHYDYIIKIIQRKTRQYDLDYDDTLNFVLDKISSENYKKIRSFRGESTFITYITVVVNRLIISFARKNKKIPEMPAIEIPTPLDILIQQQRIECKELFIKKLPELLNELSYKERLVLKMRFFKDLRISQIANDLRMTRYEINKLLNSGLDFLRNKIREICKK